MKRKHFYTLLPVIFKISISDYDAECCKKNCPCSSPTVEETSDSKFDMFVKMFKPEDEAEMKNEEKTLDSKPELSDEKKQEVDELVSKFIASLTQLTQQ